MKFQSLITRGDDQSISVATGMYRAFFVSDT